MGGLILIGMGLVFLASQFLNVQVWHYLWPFFFVGLGFLFFIGMFLGGKQAGGLAIPGSLLTTLGLIFAYQNTFNQWASWSYAWALLAPTSVGIGLMIFGRWSDKPKVSQSGRMLTLVGLIIFLFMGTFFELLLALGRFDTLGRFVWPLLLIGLGVVLLVSGLVRRVSSPPFTTPSAIDDPVKALPTNTTGGNA